MSDQVPTPQPPPPWLGQVVPGLLVAAVVGICGLFMQVTRIDQAMATVSDDISELKNDSKQRLADLEERVRALEVTKHR